MSKTEQWTALKTRSLWRSLNERQRSLLAVELDICAAAAVAEARAPLVAALEPWADFHDKLAHRSKQHCLDTYAEECSVQDIMADDYDRSVFHNKPQDP